MPLHTTPQGHVQGRRSLSSTLDPRAWRHLPGDLATSRRQRDEDNTDWAGSTGAADHVHVSDVYNMIDILYKGFPSISAPIGV